MYNNLKIITVFYERIIGILVASYQQANKCISVFLHLKMIKNFKLVGTYKFIYINNKYKYIYNFNFNVIITKCFV